MRARRKLGILENILISLGAGAAILGCDGGPVDNRPPEITNQTVLETPE